MHICIPDTREVRPAHGGAYLLYNVHIDGLYHCSLRFKQLLHLHQALTKRFASTPYHQLPTFPPKKLLPLSATQVEERRQQSEKYLQNVSQDKEISNSSIFNLFLLEAQRESTRIREAQVHLDIELVNGQKIRLQIVTHDSADSVLTSVCRALGLQDRYHAYFCLCLCGYDVVRDKLIIKRRLSFFEAPFITLQMAIQQQEQLQNVLASTANGNGYYKTIASTTTTTTTTSSVNSNNNNINNNCSCSSCPTQQQQSNSTGVPLVGSSSSGRHNGNSTNSLGHYNQQHNHHQQRQLFDSNCMQSSSSNTSSSLTSSSSSSSRSFVTHRILLRKSYWDPIYDSYLLNDQQALNLLFIQTVYDIKHSLMFVDRETYHQLEALLAADSKLEYILLARTLKYYNYVHFEPCLSDYPRPRTKVMISIGSKELNMRVLKSPASIAGASSRRPAAAATTISDNNEPSTANQQPSSSSSSSTSVRQPNEPILYCTSSLIPSGYHHLITKEDIVEEEYNFKVPLIRCWRLTSLETLNNNNDAATAGSNQNRAGSRRSSVASQTATTTLAGGKRKSLSLFNSVVGSNPSTISSSPPNSCCDSTGSSPTSRTTFASGTDGASLMAALTGSDLGRLQRHFNGCDLSGGGGNHYQSAVGHDSYLCQQQHQQHQYCQHENQRCCHQQVDYTQFSQYELSFEYLIARDTLRWITISSDQAIFISISLQGVVDELVSKRDGNCSLLYDKTPTTTSPLSAATDVVDATTSPLDGQRRMSLTRQSSVQDNQMGASSFTYQYRDGSQKQLNTSNQQLIDKFGTTLGYSPMNSYSLALARQRHQYQRASLLQQPPVASASSSLSAATSRFNWSIMSSSPASSASSQPIQSSFWWGQQQQQEGSSIGAGQPAASFEISSLKKAPSPIINDAFEGVTNDDDL